MRLIDADALKELFIRCDGSRYGTESIIYAIDSAPTIEPVKYGKWIPVSERLPERDEYVFVTTIWNSVTIAKRLQYCWDYGAKYGFYEYDEILAWMPLPEPWKGEAMSDLIDRQALLGEIEKEREYLVKRGQLGAEHVLVHSLRRIVEEFPSVNQWIPCKERMPEQGERVIVCLNDWHTGEQEIDVTYRRDCNMWHGHGRYADSCVAWMPLPEPWKGEEE